MVLPVLPANVSVISMMVTFLCCLASNSAVSQPTEPPPMTTTVLLAAGEELPKNVIGVLADCGFSTAKEIICKVVRQIGLPAGFVYPFIRLGARLYGGFDPNEADAPAALRKCQIPVIFFHGSDDDFVPWEMSKQNYDACASEKKLVCIPKAGHGLSYLIDPPGYLGALREFGVKWGL